MKKIKILNSKMVQAEKRLEKAMLKIWPEESTVQFMIAHNQKLPSTGLVMGCNAPYLRVKMDTDRGAVKDVHFDSILP